MFFVLRKILTLLLVVSMAGSPFVVFAQQEASNWVFGVGGGLDFSCSTPQFYSTPFDGLEGGAVISSADGDLLFFTDGNVVWSRDYQIMPNGHDLGGLCAGYGNYASSSQSALIIPHPGESNLYYIFTTDCTEDGFAAGLRYSVVDLSLNGGMGDVTQKNKPLVANTEEKVAAVFQSNGKDVWVLTHGVQSNKFYAFSITSAGLNTTPIISSIGQSHPGGRGYMKFSPDGQRLAVACFLYGYNNDGIPLELFKFNISTGQVTSDFVIPTGTEVIYGVSFSPNGRVLYTSCAWGCSGSLIQQYNLDAGTPQQIYDQRYTIRDTYVQGGMQLANDGKLYFLSTNSTKVEEYLGVIMYPDKTGNACEQISNYVELPCWTGVTYGVPNFIESYFREQVTNGNCTQKNESFVENFDFGISSDCHTRSVFFDNKSSVIDAELSRPTLFYSWLINFGDGAIHWSRVPEDATHTYATPGTYTVTLSVSSAGCVIYSMQQLVTIGAPSPKFSYKQDCKTLAVNFNNLTSEQGEAYTLHWDFGDNSIDNTSDAKNPTHKYAIPGKYAVTLTATNDCGSSSTQMEFQVYEPLSVSLGPDTAFCFETDYILKVARQPKASYRWSTGDTWIDIKVTTPGEYSVIASRDGCVVSDVIQLKYEDCDLCSTVVKDLQLGSDTTICETDLIHLGVDKSVKGEFLWSNSQTEHGIDVTEAGKYWLTLIQGNCQTSDTVTVDIRDCTVCDVFIPNVFTPNIDSKNDVFAVDVRCEHYAFRLTIYNRWGDKLITVYEPSWNGRIGNEFVSPGIYYYAVQYSFTGPQSRVITHQKKGWLHVVR